MKHILLSLLLASFSLAEPLPSNAALNTKQTTQPDSRRRHNSLGSANANAAQTALTSEPIAASPAPKERGPNTRAPQAARERRPAGFLQSPTTSRATAAAIISYDPDEVYTIYTKVRFVTALVFPEPERIVQVLTGDKDWWQTYVDPPGSGTERIIYVKPAKPGIATNLTAIGSTGNIYQFFLQEITRDIVDPYEPLDPDAPPNTPQSPDVRVSIHLGQQNLLAAQTNGAKYVPKTQFDSTVHDYQEQLATATSTVQATRTAAQTIVNNEITKIRSEYPAQLQFIYDIQLNTAPFHVTGMFADEKFTYIKVATDEVPAIYEIKDGKPNLVQFDFNNGIYIVRKVLDDGYLAIGKTKLRFTRKTK